MTQASVQIRYFLPSMLGDCAILKAVQKCVHAQNVIFGTVSCKHCTKFNTLGAEMAPQFNNV